MSDPIGFVGVGAMGAPMVLRLLERGRTVLIHSRSRARAAEAERAGAVWAGSADEVVAHCTRVFSCLRDTDATVDVYLGERGMLRAAPAGRILVEFGTFSPEVAGRIAADAASAGASFLAAPVSGGPSRARTGSLTMMVGGEPEAFERVRPDLLDLAQTLDHVGGPGAGLELKLVNQLLTSCHMAVAAEAIAALNALGIDLGVAERMLGSGWAHSAMLARALDAAGQDEPDIRGTGVTVAGMSEVLELVSDLLGRHGITADVFDAGRRALLDAERRGFGDLDPAGLFRMKEVIR